MLHDQSKSTIVNVIETLELPKNMQAEQVYEKLKLYFSHSEENTTSLETLTIKTGKEANATISTSKFSNLKFRLKDLLLESSRTILKVQGAKQNWLALALVVLEFLQKVSGFMEYQLSNHEAQVLLEMYTLENEKEKITIEKLFKGLKTVLTEKQILQSLDLLEKLSCIRYGSDELNLVESIIFLPE